MTAQIYAYVNFKGNCREATTFYKHYIGAELMIQNVEGSPIESQCPLNMKNLVLHASVTKGDLILMASDMIGPSGLTQGNNISLSINRSSEQKNTDFFAKLSEGRNVTHPLQTMLWRDMFGTFTDRFGIDCMFNYNPKSNNN